MSFSRAPLKRFNDSRGCAPPPGTYDIRAGEPKGAASFDKSDRFKPIQAAAGSALPPPPPPSPSRNMLVSPVRRTMSVDQLVERSSSKKDKNGLSLERKQQLLLEKEIRSLVQQRGEQDRRLLALEEELKKVEAKLLSAVRERTALAANVTTLERQRAELKKVNEFLKNKVSADTTKKRINSLTMELMEARNHLDVKNKELNLLQVNSEGRVQVLQSDLEAVRDNVTALKERNADLGELHQVTKTLNEDLESENARLHGVIQELREELKAVQGYLDAANEQIQDLRLQIQKTDENNVAGSQVEKLKQLKTELEQRTIELQTTQEVLRLKEEHLKSSQKAVSDLEEQLKMTNQEVQDSRSTVHQQEAELVRLKEVLRRTERELDERVAHLEQRCLYSEEERSKTQEEGLRRVEELKNELNSLKENRREEETRQIQLQQEHASLTEELMKEKALVDSLSVLVEHEKKKSEEQLNKLKEEMEEVLGELALMEQGSQEMAEKSQEDLQKLQEENKELERQLCDTRALLESQSSDVAALKNEHFGKMGDIVTELESTKEALKGAKERETDLEAEVERVSCQMKEEMDKMVEQKEEEMRRVQDMLEENQQRQLAEARAGEENARMLLEVQTLLVQKDEEMRASEASHAGQINRLQQELQQQTKETEKVLGQLEELTGQHRCDREKAQKLEEVSREKEEITEQLQQERHEKVEIQSALRQEKAALEVERRDHQQVRSEVLRLQAELERAEQEKKTLLSQVEGKDLSRLALENQLSAAQQDQDRLQCRLDEVEHESASLQARADRMEETAQALRDQVEVLAQEKVTLQWEMEEQQQQLQKQLVQEQSSQHSEMEHWKNKYEELHAKVRPFQEQLNAFAAERSALLNEHDVNQGELTKLSDAYARLLGNQNHKQKIKHVMNLKDEIASLKQEVSKLRCQVSRQNNELEELKLKLPGARRRRFDPSKAFQHNKENREAETMEPLKEENHYF